MICKRSEQIFIFILLRKLCNMAEQLKGNLVHFVKIFENEFNNQIEYSKLQQYQKQLLTFKPIKSAGDIKTLYIYLSKEKINRILVQGSAEIFSIFEYQFENIRDDLGYPSKGLEKLAKDAVERIMDYTNKYPDAKLCPELLTKGVILGRSVKHATDIENITETGYMIKLFDKYLSTTTLYEMPGRVVLAKNKSVKYYSKCDNDVCGFRLLFPWERLDDSFEEVTGPTVEYKYVLNSESLNDRISVLLQKIGKKHERYFDVDDPIKLFTGRSVILAKLHETLLKYCQVSVCGLGGVGKTELVRKYIQTFGNEYDGRIVWINAEYFNDSLRRFHKRNTGRQDDDVRTIIECVEKDFSSGKSLFVFDNAGERQNTIDSDVDYCLRKLRKSNSDIFVLVTSRNRNWGDVRVIDLNSLTKEEAEELIRKGLHIKHELQETEIRDLVDKLQCLPLALQQAVSYIKHVNDACLNVGQEYSIKDYLEDFDSKLRILLDHKLPEEGDDKYTNTVFTTWDITIDKISAHSMYGEQAKELLDIIAYFASDNIPTEIFSNSGSEWKAMELLKQHSMISMAEDGIAFNVHQLVQKVIRLKMTEHELDLEFFEKIYRLLNRQGLGNTNDMEKIRKLLPHLGEFLKHLENNVSCYSIILKLLSTISNFPERCGVMGYAIKELLERALKIIGTNFEVPNCDFDNILSIIGFSGSIIDAKKTVAHKNKYLDDLMVVRLLEILANAEGCLRNYETKKKLLQQILSIKEKRYGASHIELQDTKNQMQDTSIIQLARLLKEVFTDKDVGGKDRKCKMANGISDRTIAPLGNFSKF